MGSSNSTSTILASEPPRSYSWASRRPLSRSERKVIRKASDTFQLTSLNYSEAPPNLAPTFEGETDHLSADYKTIRFAADQGSEYWVAVQLLGGQTDFYLRIWVSGTGQDGRRVGQAWQIALPNGRLGAQAYAQLVCDVLQAKQRQLVLAGFLSMMADMTKWATSEQSWSRFMAKYKYKA
jgi:hypothetical protein